MNPRELRMHFLELQPPKIRIVRDGFHYRIQIQHCQQTDTLTSNQGEQLRFSNIDDARATLHSLGLQVA